MSKVGIGTVIFRSKLNKASRWTKEEDIIERETKTQWVTRNRLRFYKNRVFPTFPIGDNSAAFYLKQVND